MKEQRNTIQIHGGCAKTDLERKGVQDIFTVIAHTDALIDFAKRREPSTPKDQRENHEKGRVEKNVRAKWNNQRGKFGGQAIHGVFKDVQVKIREWVGMIDFSVARPFLMRFSNSLCILDGGKTYMVSMERDSKCAARPFWPCNSKNYTRVSLAFSGDKARDVRESNKVEVPKEIERVLDELKDVMTKILPPRREVDHAIKL
uniref:Reverse transcriptase domain-containing protein n=1 Tax=Tanacetum cinerariifolium TaxID=118510 RepID=A0A6L2KR34_TANCI|nr:hypothetical protein [Tanacetum cinerariifolium]